MNVALLPAMSVTTTCAVRPDPSTAMESGLALLVENTPDSASFASNAIDTAVEFQPSASAAGEPALKVSVGATVSRRIVTELVAVPPSEVALQVKVTPEVSSLTEVVAHPVLEETFDSASETVQEACTSLRYQPPLPSVPVRSA